MDFSIKLERLTVDDTTLKDMYRDLSAQTVEKEKLYKKLSSCPDNNYLRYTIARLAYEFAKEEYESVVYEMKERGMLAS
jgi:hypothetical protein